MNVTIQGLRPIATAGVTTPVSIDSATALTLPTTAQRKKGGVMVCNIVIEGASKAARYTTNGVAPTTAVGNLTTTATATAPVTLQLVGEELITAFRIIGTATGATITYWFAVADIR